MKVNLNYTRFLHLIGLIICSFLLGYSFWYYFEWTKLTSMGAAVTIVCQINNVMISKDVQNAIKDLTTTTGGGAVEEEGSRIEDKPPSSSRTNNKKKKKAKPRKEM